MQGRDVFGALLRLLGFWYFVQALYLGLFVLMRAIGLMPNGTAEGQEKIVIGFYILIGIILVAGADAFVLAIYGRRK